MKRPALTTILIGLVLLIVGILIDSLWDPSNHLGIKSILAYKSLGLLLTILFLLTLIYLLEKPSLKKHKDHKTIKAILKALIDKKDDYLNLATINGDSVLPTSLTASVIGTS
jgi:hypothetical protein